MKKPRDLIFDLDGTLWETTAVCALGWNDAATRLGLPKTDYVAADVAAIMGLTAEEVRLKLFPAMTEADGRLAQRQFFEGEVLRLEASGQDWLYPGVNASLRELATRHRLFIVSNCEEPYLEVFFKLSGLREIFADWECYGHTQLPKAANLRMILVRNEIKSAIYVGDTPGDQNAAALCHLPFAWASYGYGVCTGADLTLQNFDGLAAQLATLAP